MQPAPAEGRPSEAPTDAPEFSPGTSTEAEAISGFPPWMPSACQTITATGERSLTSDSCFSGPGAVHHYLRRPARLLAERGADHARGKRSNDRLPRRRDGRVRLTANPPGTRRALSQRPVVIRDIDIHNVETGIAVGSVGRTTVERTSIANATIGIQLEPTDGQSSIDNAVVRHNRIGNVWAGIDIIRGNGATVQQNTVTAQGRGVRLFDSTGCTLADNAVSGTNENSGAAIGLSGEGGHTLVRNTAVGSQDGISMERCHGNTIARTAAIDNGGYGIRLRDCDSNVIEESTANYNNFVGVAMQSGSQNNTIQDSVMLWNDANAGLSPTEGSSGDFVLGTIISRNGTPVFVDGTSVPATYTSNIESY